jgi:hypothetical protein
MGSFGVVFDPFPEEEILDYLAQGSFIRVLTVGALGRSFQTCAKALSVPAYRPFQT